MDLPKLSGNNLIANATFSDGKALPWTNSFSAPASGRSFVAKDGELCVEVTNKGANNWDVQLRHREMVIQKGHSYAISFKAHATRPTRMRLKVGMAGAPYAEYWTDAVDLLTRPQTFVGTFTMGRDDDATAEFALHMGGALAGEGPVPFNVCIDDVNLDDPQFVRKEAPKAAPIPNVLVNQVGYLPHLPKIATVKSASKTPETYQLLSSGGKVVASGTTLPIGPDATSGDTVHIADFSSFEGPGRGYTLKVAGAVSHPFDIEADVYKKLKYDALAYFYHNRSGIEIAMPYAGGKQWTRPAGHAGKAPNQGDDKVPCLANSGCNYTLDVTGGWYDAGDHGKYVVNAGISVWTMLNQYERAKYLGTSSRDFADGKMAIPEKKNGVPDILDEARWELEFELKMQVPAGQPLAGMAHHKIHDLKWTELGTPPQDDKIPRFLWPPSTAATLNLAANAAQGARIWNKLDKKFAARCLEAAERAWTAAEAHPALFAGTEAIGGGPYDDKNVSDEFYWAAAELYTTTKKDVYKAFLTKSPHFKAVPIADPGERPPHADGLGRDRGAGDDHPRRGAERAGRRQHRRRAQEHRGGRRRLRGSDQDPGLPHAFQAGHQGLPLGVELVRAQQRDRDGAGVRLHQGAEVSRRRQRGDELPAGAQPDGSVVRHRLRPAPARASAPSLLGPPGRRQIAGPAAGRDLGRPQFGSPGSVRSGGRSGRLRAGQVLRRSHRSVVGERDRDQLELAPGVGRGVSRREGQHPRQRQGRRQPDRVTRQALKPAKSLPGFSVDGSLAPRFAGIARGKRTMCGGMRVRAGIH